MTFSHSKGQLFIYYNHTKKTIHTHENIVFQTKECLTDFVFIITIYHHSLPMFKRNHFQEELAIVEIGRYWLCANKSHLCDCYLFEAYCSYSYTATLRRRSRPDPETIQQLKEFNPNEKAQCVAAATLN
ncbi:unnamed protein product [Adineta ricciae]|uniref:Uncharacterized protein n=1 Tax=Adineta ricciae TaxID=249248 RepID=A0A814I6E4_ADIRI|nr:unnamed protein product [Adineta ricciae]